MNIEELKKQTLESELAHLEKIVQNKSEELKETQKLKNNQIIELNKEIEKLLLEKENLISEIEIFNSKFLPRAEFLKSWESQLIKKERDLNVIIERYQRLYSENGVGFKL